VYCDCPCADVAPSVASAHHAGAAAAAAGVALDSASSSAPVLPLQQRLSDPAALKSFYNEHGYVVERGVPEAKQLFSEIAAAKPRSAKFSTFIAGKMVQLDTLAAKAADAAKGFTISMLTMAVALAIATTNKVSACSARLTFAAP
jgi:N-acetylglutamate synthase/N-acetylornithine aminotransferase